MYKRISLHIGELICLIAAVFFVSYLLSNVQPISISSAWSYINHWSKPFHILAVGLLPVYVALMVFGTATVGIYLGSALQRIVTQYILHKRLI